MTVLTGILQSVSGRPFGGPENCVLIYSRMTRPGFSVDGVILELHDKIPMPTEAAGHFETKDLDPGPIRVELEGDTVQGLGWDIDLPESGTHSLASLIDAQVEWSPAVVGRAEAAAALAGAEADRAVAGAVRAEEAATLLESALPAAADLVRVEVAADADRSEHAREGAEAARADAEVARDDALGAAAGAAVQVRTELAGEIGRVDAAVTVAEGHAEDASVSAGAAAGSAARAGNYADAAEGNATVVAGMVSVAEGHAEDASVSAGAAGVSATQADGSATQADGSATQADGHRRAAETARDEAVVARSGAEAARDAAQEAADNAQTGAPPEGWSKADLDLGVRESLRRADLALQSVPDATEETRGAVRLAGDLGGTAHAPTVPGLAGKAAREHRHGVGEIDGLPEIAMIATPDTLAQRLGNGHLAVPETPTHAGHATSKGYVDALVASHEHLISQIEGLQERIARLDAIKAWWVWDSDEGEFVMPAGAIVGDIVIDSATGDFARVIEEES